jgi:hypothetical protein
VIMVFVFCGGVSGRVGCFIFADPWMGVKKVQRVSRWKGKEYKAQT